MNRHAHRKGIAGIALVLVVLLVLGALLVMPVIGSYNKMVAKGTEVDTALANVQSQLQRRLDLIDNLVNSVKGAMQQEKDVFGQIADARSKMAGARTAEDTVAADNELTGALGRLLVVTENYPELKSNENVRALMDELAGTENRIQVARKDYNDTVSSYNVMVRSFPTNLAAGILGFKPKPFFEASANAQNAPKVDFNTPQPATSTP